MPKFTSVSYKPDNEFLPINEILESENYYNLTTAHKEQLYRYGKEEFTTSKWSSIICQDKEVNSVGPKYDLILHSSAIDQTVNTLIQAGIEIKGRINDFGPICWLDMIFDNLKISDPTGSDISLGYSMRNGYSFHGLNIIPFCVRWTCTNGGIFNQTPKLHGLMDPINVSHVGNAAKRLVDRMKSLLQDTIAVKNVFLELFNSAANEYYVFNSEKELELTISQYGLSEFRTKEALNRGTIDLTNCSKYELYNCLTDYASHIQLSAGLYQSFQNAAEKVLNSTPEMIETKRKVAEITIGN